MATRIFILSLSVSTRSVEIVYLKGERLEKSSVFDVAEFGSAEFLLQLVVIEMVLSARRMKNNRFMGKNLRKMVEQLGKTGRPHRSPLSPIGGIPLPLGALREGGGLRKQAGGSM